MENQVKSTIHEHVSHQNIHLFSRFFPYVPIIFPWKTFIFLEHFPLPPTARVVPAERDV